MPADTRTAGAGRSLVLEALAVLALGVAAGLTWAALAPVTAARSDGVERVISGEVTLAGLGLLAGLVLALYGLLWPGSRPELRFVTRLLASVAAAALAWGTGRLAGAPVLIAAGVVLLWPLTHALVTALVTLIRVLVRPDLD